MPDWDFKTIEFYRDAEDGMKRKHRIVELSSKQQKKTNIYAGFLKTAAESTVANPKFSNYFVKASIGGYADLPLPVGNIEYGFCQAIHGEESAVAALRSHYGRRLLFGDDELVLGIIAGGPGLLASPCGNCRDIMRDELGENFEIVSGAKEGGLAIVTKMGDYLFRDYQCIPLKQATSMFGPLDFGVDLWVTRTIGAGKRLENDAYGPSNDRKYYALINARLNGARDYLGAEYYGAHDIMCEYHPIYALRDAVRQARRAHNPFINYVLVVGEFSDGRPPDVMYKDRQHLLELNLEQELLLGEEKDPPVYLAAVNGDKELLGVWKTSVKEWLPVAFSPRNFGDEFIRYLTEYYKNKRRQ